jgi:hypothetical protein
MDERHLIWPNTEEETINGQDPGMMWMLGPFTCYRILVDFFYGNRIRVRLDALASCTLFSDPRQPHLCQQGRALLVKCLVLRRSLNQL